MKRKMIAYTTVMAFMLLLMALSTNVAQAASNCSAVQASGTTWLNGNGVDVRSNGTRQGTEFSCASNGNEIYNLSAQPPQFGYGWQCVELVNRLYNSRGWSGPIYITNGAAKNLYSDAANGKFAHLAAYPNGGGYKPVSGDIIVHAGSGAGHVAVVDYTAGGILYAVEQNASDTGRNTYVYNSSTGGISRSGVVISGYVHSDLNASAATPVSTTSRGPKAFTDAAGNLHVVITTSGGINHYVKAPGGTWAGEVVTSGQFTSALDAYESSDNNLHIYAVTNGGINHYAKTPGGAWAGEVAITGDFSSSLTAFSDTSNGLHVIVKTTGGWLDHFWKSSGSYWDGEVISGGTFNYDPSAYISPSNEIHVFAVTNGGINHYVKTLGGNWAGEVVTGGTFTSSPGVFANAGGAIDLFAITSGGINHYAKYANAAWTGEVVTGGSFVSAPSVFADTNGDQHVFVGTTGGINHYVRVPGGAWAGEVVTNGVFTFPITSLADSTHTIHIFSQTSGGINHYAKGIGGSWGGEIIT